MHLRIVQQRLAFIQNSFVRTYKHQTKIFGYNTQLKTIGNTKEIEKILCDYNQARQANPHVALLIDAYRKHGHRLAKIDPLGITVNTSIPELDNKLFTTDFHVENEHDARSLFGLSTEQSIPKTKDDWIRQLNDTYCQSISLECEYIESDIERLWIARRFEQLRSSPSISSDLQRRIYEQMRKCEAFDQFLQAKFPTLKRYSGEGAEGMMAFFDLAFQNSAQLNIENVIVCMPHRGRNNLLVCLLNYPAATMIRKIKGKNEFPKDVKTTGDVLSHLYTSTDLTYDGKTLHVSLIPNPSHLEANNPVAVGKTRACQLSLKEGHYADTEQDGGRHGDKALCIQVHGDASFAGQGIIPETFQLSHLPHYSIGGSIHLVTNNQIGYTTPQHLARSSRYCTDFAKVVNCPIIHVNGQCPQEIAQAVQLSCEYRDLFRKDIVVDLVCFRKHGHNELDDPTFTQPTMYKKVQDYYKQEQTTDNELDEKIKIFRNTLEEQFSIADKYQPKAPHLERQWSDMIQAKSTRAQWNTGLDGNLLKYIGVKSVLVPEEFQVHSTIARSHVQKRQQRIEAGNGLDWSTAESLAFGSLLLQNYNIRISGQDVGRGTFSQRHGMLVNQKNDDVYIPLNSMDSKQGFLEICNSILSEEAVLGFDYGFSIHDPKNLVIWEAQFGDFFNGAQIIIDTYISGGELKFLTQSGIVMLLPHGMDGAGPEHSSCHIERFLQMTDSKENGIDGDDINMQVVNPTTPAQYFHLLRRQMIRNFRKPLIVAAPKILLRHPDCISSLTDMADGTHFLPVLTDNLSKIKINPEKIKRILFTSGKHYYTLNEERDKRKRDDLVIIRLEELCPFPADELRQEIKKYKNAKDFIWCQEEHRNQGAWTFIRPRFENIVGTHLKYAGRDVLGTPAVAIGEIHQQECAQLLKLAFD
ncbi:unnamed protein product [Adineta steineri]|uniref:Transketolase-like pyrimidine-binding domain-containing protein n=1 Tax=Adineta steineri TaxID=433720 RepID=A0A814BWL5_9BILA|nr:unnamed protein product [Adineta steineri]CAF3891107.1 unnamed protein product [Adineta steineri]